MTFYEVCGEYFKDFEYAHDTARELISPDELFDQFDSDLLHRIFSWCLNNNDFVDKFYNEICDAEEKIIDETINTWESDDKDFLEQIKFLDEE
jgi:hypothetical protein